MPAVAARFLLGPVLVDYGFRFRYPTLEHGVQQVLGALHDSRTAPVERRIGAQDEIGKEQP
jgi:hypothetical protein